MGEAGRVHGRLRRLVGDDWLARHGLDDDELPP
jgi:hypothetical protein